MRKTVVLLSFIFMVCVKMESQHVLMQTSYGDVELKLYDETPLHKANFLKLVSEGFYDGVLFHRVIANFMIQGGDPMSKTAQPSDMLGNGDVGYTIPAEFCTPAIYHKKGVLAAARQGDAVNPKKESSGCQFYIVVGKVFTDDELDNLERGKKMKLSVDSALVQSGHFESYYKFTPEQREAYKTVGGTPHLDGEYTVFGEVVKGLDIIEKISVVQTGRMNRPIEDVKILKISIIQ